MKNSDKRFIFGSASPESRRAVHKRLAKLRASVRDDDARIAAAAEKRQRRRERNQRLLAERRKRESGS